MALNQLAQHEQIPAERGEITDASGVLLATSVELPIRLRHAAIGRGS